MMNPAASIVLFMCIIVGYAEPAGTPGSDHDRPRGGEGFCDLPSAFEGDPAFVASGVVLRRRRSRRRLVVSARSKAWRAFTSGGSALGPQSAELPVSKTEWCRIYLSFQLPRWWAHKGSNLGPAD
jgi:hypothetical protein